MVAKDPVEDAMVHISRNERSYEDAINQMPPDLGGRGTCLTISVDPSAL